MKYILILLLSVVLYGTEANAQCAMCRATVESNLKSKNESVKGLNTGILYLMSIPYLLIGALAFLWYNNSRKETEKQNRIFEILRRKLT